MQGVLQKHEMFIKLKIKKETVSYRHHTAPPEQQANNGVSFDFHVEFYGTFYAV